MTPKRSLSPENNDTPDAKRPKIDELQGVQGTSEPPDIIENVTSQQESPAVTDRDNPATADNLVELEAPLVSTLPTLHSQSRETIQRSIALVLNHDGFDAATPEALEGFTQLVETYLESIIGETKRHALVSRREQPIPPDFEKVLKRHNVPIVSLKPHLRPPVSRERMTPKYSEAIILDDDAFTTLPLLSNELSGQADKDEKLYIPKTFPDFPSRHTYRFTPQDDPHVRDPQQIREKAARTAQQGEDALRRLVRASKMRKQKEVKSLVERDVQGKERYRLWEATMRGFIAKEGSGGQGEEIETADHSMIVNGDGIYSRKEVPRGGKRASNLTTGNMA